MLSFAILAEYFPQEVSGRANAALNLLHVGAAFVLQSAMGIIIAQWPQTNGGYAVAAHEAAMTAGICIQLLALGWFALPRRGTHIGYGANLPPPASSKTQSDDDTRSLRRHPIASTRKAAETARRKLASCGRGFHNLVYWVVDGAMGSNRRS